MTRLKKFQYVSKFRKTVTSFSIGQSTAKLCLHLDITLLTNITKKSQCVLERNWVTKPRAMQKSCKHEF